MRSTCLLSCVLLATASGCNDHRPPPGKPAPPGSARSASAPDACVRDPANPVAITSDSIGPLDFHLTLDALRRRCPSARDTDVYGEENTNNAVLFGLGPVSAAGAQNIPGGTALRLDAPADYWVVSGAAARLPGGLSLASRMGELRSTYGAGVARVAETATVEFCSLTYLQFRFNVPGAEIGETGDLSFIPDGTPVQEVWVSSGPDRHAYSLCAGRTAAPAKP
jgi:hypothetical protein